jgi:Ca2+-binding RTX toxin-like protein
MIGSGFVTLNEALIDGNIAYLSVAMDGYGAYAMSFSLNNVDLSSLKGMIEAAPAGDLTGVLGWLLGGRDFIGAAAGNHNDWIRGFAGNDQIWGYGGNDVLKGDAGDDTLWGGKGADKLNGGSGVDTAVYADFTKAIAVTLDGANYAVVTAGGVKQDKIKNIENIRGGEAADTLAGDGADNILFGNRGYDRLSGRGGNDTLQGEDGNDTLIGGKGADDLIGGSGRDTMTGGKGAAVFSFVESPDLDEGGHYYRFPAWRGCDPP